MKEQVKKASKFWLGWGSPEPHMFQCFMVLEDNKVAVVGPLGTTLTYRWLRNIKAAREEWKQALARGWRRLADSEVPYWAPKQAEEEAVRLLEAEQERLAAGWEHTDLEP